MGDQLVAGGSILSKVQLAVARISSADRQTGDPNNFSVFLTPQVGRCIGYYVNSISINNDWYTLDEDEVASYWKLNAGAITEVKIPAGYYDATLGPTSITVTETTGGPLPAAVTSTATTTTQTMGYQFATQLQASLRSGLSNNNISVAYDPRVNKLSFTAGAGNTLIFYTHSVADGTGTFGTLSPVLGFPNGLTSVGTAASLATQTEDLNINYYDPPFVNINSPQLRQPIGIDSKLNGGSNSFLHMRIDVPKTRAATFLNLAPTEFTVIKYPGPQEFQYLNLSVTDPREGDLIDIGQDWEMIMTFLMVV